MADPLSVAASVAGLVSLGIQVTQSLVAFYAACKGQKTDISSTSRKLEHLLGVLEILHGQLASRQFRADEQGLLEKIESSIQVCDECVQELQSENDKFKGGSKDGIRAAAQTASRRLAYPFRQSTLQKLDENIDETVSQLSLVLQMLQQKDIGCIQDGIGETKALLDLKHPSTGLWLVKGSSFSASLEKSNSFLWLNSFAGCGKSVLCSTAIQYAFRHRRSNPRIGIAFFFFTFNDNSKQDTSSMLRAVVLQLSSQLNDNHGFLSQLHSNYRNAMPPDQALADCLRQIVRAFDDVYIILDALDESPRDTHRGEVLQMLVDLRAWGEPGLHLLVTSREEPDIGDVLHKELNALPDEVVSMKNSFVESDIAAFISEHLQDNRKLRKWKEYHDRIETTLSQRAKGVFRWVECQFKALEQCPECEDLLDQLLASLPQSLDQTYERMLSNIPPASVRYAQQMLTLLCCALRPLTVPELIDGIAVELGDSPKFNPKPATVRLAHFSVQEYLESGRSGQHSIATFRVRRREAHTNIARICLTYLLEPALLMSEKPIKEYPLAPYAAELWHEHLREGDENAHHAKHQALRLFQIVPELLSNIPLEPPLSVPNPTQASSLFNARRGNADVNAKGGFYGSALQTASGNGYEKIVQLLLERNADAASSNGYEKIVHLLLERNADVDAEGEYYGTALQRASARGYEKLVQLLLERNANVNAKGGFYGTALQTASAEGHEKIVQLFLERNADVNAKGGLYGTALQAASAEGYEEIAQLLLEKNADVNAKGGRYGTALQAASVMGREKTVQLLLEKGAHRV
ncbi:hypothetical protein QBC33DRAFT_596465 [Phialemonium atrogriseum]|uniref:NACHT domain-containing protein n=1 Tax=Phialemonium atrogriseum TaxID=1093897 RepID=A0AAJ0FCP1_9PEZI|nr:uncharacterized protein QBC33DRAFT_596465 [Phialemonium atrogriseum]KAK1763796.1 hypothetical protein QBC33DRAFT_596465 [Phialemonium atrogriseum]